MTRWCCWRGCGAAVLHHTGREKGRGPMLDWGGGRAAMRMWLMAALSRGKTEAVQKLCRPPADSCRPISVVGPPQGNTDVMAKLVNALPPHEFRKCRNYALIQAASGG
eukprot:360637-Chlamydomonas_euryale.AAC.5